MPRERCGAVRCGGYQAPGLASGMRSIGRSGRAGRAGGGGGWRKGRERNGPEGGGCYLLFSMISGDGFLGGAERWRDSVSFFVRDRVSGTTRENVFSAVVLVWPLRGFFVSFFFTQVLPFAWRVVRVLALFCFCFFAMGTCV